MNILFCRLDKDHLLLQCNVHVLILLFSYPRHWYQHTNTNHFEKRNLHAYMKRHKRMSTNRATLSSKTTCEIDFVDFSFLPNLLHRSKHRINTHSIDLAFV